LDGSDVLGDRAKYKVFESVFVDMVIDCLFEEVV
jgi:hypothetical protein